MHTCLSLCDVGVCVHVCVCVCVYVCACVCVCVCTCACVYMGYTSMCGGKSVDISHRDL